jgi:hypothetical protein
MAEAQPNLSTLTFPLVHETIINDHLNASQFLTRKREYQRSNMVREDLVNSAVCKVFLIG